MPAPNIVNVTTITGKTSVQATTTTPTAIVTNLSGSAQVIKVNALYLANIDAANTVDVDVDVFRSSTATRIAKAITVPVKSTLDYISKSIYLEEGDSLRITASANSRLESVCSYEVIS
jgi:hypothetical protein